MAPSKVAILHVPHLCAEESVRKMLLLIGYSVYGIDTPLSRQLNSVVLPRVASRICPKAKPRRLQYCNLFVTVKHYCVPSLVKHFPVLKNRILWFDINGGVPGDVIKAKFKTYPKKVPVPYLSANKHYTDDSPYGVSGPRYICYIPINNQVPYLKSSRRNVTEPPICLIHNVYNWGYGWVIDRLRKNQVQFYGGFKSPGGLLSSEQVVKKLDRSLCYVHMKGHDCPGYSLYEAMLSGCPVILPSVFLDRTRFTDLYEPNVTCLVANDDTSLGVEERAVYLERSILACIDQLRDMGENRRIGSAGRERIKLLMWSSQGKDLESFRTFMETNFP